MNDETRPTNVVPLRRAEEKERDPVELLLKHIRAELVRRAHETADAIAAELEAGEDKP